MSLLSDAEILARAARFLAANSKEMKSVLVKKNKLTAEEKYTINRNLAEVIATLEKIQRRIGY